MIKIPALLSVASPCPVGLGELELPRPVRMARGVIGEPQPGYHLFEYKDFHGTSFPYYIMGAPDNINTDNFLDVEEAYNITDKMDMIEEAIENFERYTSINFTRIYDREKYRDDIGGGSILLSFS